MTPSFERWMNITFSVGNCKGYALFAVAVVCDVNYAIKNISIDNCS